MRKSTKSISGPAQILTGILAISAVSFCSPASAQELVKVQQGASITIEEGSSMLVMGNMTLENGSRLVNNGTITLKPNGANGTANWNDQSLQPYHYGSGKVQFQSAGAQVLSSPNTFGTIDVDAAQLLLASDIRSDKWYLINGRINTSAYRAIATGSSATAIEADAANPQFSKSWFNGHLRRYVDPARVNQYIFPVGDAIRVNPLVLDNLSARPMTNIRYIDAGFGPKTGSDVGLVAAEDGQGYVSVNNGGVWYLSGDSKPVGGTYDLQLYFNGFAGLSDNSFGILGRTDASSRAADWTVPAGSRLPDQDQPGRTLSAGFARRNQLSSFNEYGIGVLSGQPTMTQLVFDAQRLGKTNVEIKWETIAESNSRGFEVERRLDGEKTFSTVGFTASKAIPGKQEAAIGYSFIDANGFSGVSYYRLKQVNDDNRSIYTHIKAVKGLGPAQVSVMLYPNPNYGQFTVRLDGVDRAYDAQITDMGGKTIRQLRLSNNNAVHITGLSAGTYMIRIPDVFGQGEAFTEKVMVVK